MKKRVLSGLLAFVMLLSALPMGVYAAETRYSVAASPDQTTDVGKTVSMSVSVSGGKYNAYDLALTYDTARLTYVSGQAADKGASVAEKSGSIRVIGYGADKSASTKVVTLTFKTKAAGTAKVVISSANIDTGANAPTKNAPPAAISRRTTKFTIQPGYTVTLDEGLASDSLSAAAGEDYTFRATDPLHYDYKPSAKIGGKDVTVKDNGDGTYTIPGGEINGNITVKANRTPKTYKVTFKGEDLSGEKTAAYNTPYHFKLNRKAGYSYVLRVTIGGKSYTGYKAENGGYVIPGAAVTGDIVVTAQKTKINSGGGSSSGGSGGGSSAKYVSVSFIGSGADDAVAIMLALLAAVFWLTITGANYPSQWLSDALFWVQDRLSDLFAYLNAPAWLHGALVLGVYRVLAWVVSVMLPPMAIFFPLFTLLEDFGYLPRVAFVLDHAFQRAKACGKQALTMCMGFGCNAAGVVGCRIIDSPRERLIAILTNNFVPCNGRFPPPEKGQIAPPGQQGLQGLPPGGGVGRDGQADFNVSRVIAAHMPRLLFHKAMLLSGKKERRGQRPRR